MHNMRKIGDLMDKKQHGNWKNNFMISTCFVMALMLFAVLPAQAQQPVIIVKNLMFNTNVLTL